MNNRQLFERHAGDNPPADGGGWVDVTRPGDKQRQWMLAYPSLPDTDTVRVLRSTAGTAEIDVPREKAHEYFPYSNEAKEYLREVAQGVADDDWRRATVFGKER